MYEFSPGFIAEVRRTGVEPLNLVRPIIHTVHHLLSDIFEFEMCGRL